jgi:membrane protein implicated in regulation of membrane protease activity
MNDQASIGDLVKQLRDDSTSLIRDEVALAKTEISEEISMVGKNIGFLVAGALVGYAALVILLIALGSLIAEGLVAVGLPLALAHFLGLAIIAIIVGLISAALVKKALDKLKTTNLVPERTVESLKNNKEFVEDQIK